MAHRAIAAAVTPLRNEGTDVDDEAFGPLIRFLSEGGMDGLLALGTTGEGVLLSTTERERVCELFVKERPDRFDVLVHCGAQSTADTVRLARHAREIGADGVAVIGPPYFPLDEQAQLAHFLAAARACAPLPFYVYEFAARSGYAVSRWVIERIRDRAPNLRGLKVSDAPIEAVDPYLIDGLEILVGYEPLALEAMRRGASGVVSGLATAFPELISSLVRTGDPTLQARVSHMRKALEGLPFHASMKTLIGARGLPVRDEVRAPLRALSPGERDRALALLEAQA